MSRDEHLYLLRSYLRTLIALSSRMCNLTDRIVDFTLRSFWSWVASASHLRTYVSKNIQCQVLRDVVVVSFVGIISLAGVSVLTCMN